MPRTDCQNCQKNTPLTDWKNGMTIVIDVKIVIQIGTVHFINIYNIL